MVKFGIVPELRGSSGEAAREIGNAVAVEHVALAVVLRVDQRIGLRNQPTKGLGCGTAGVTATVGVSGTRQIGVAEVGACLPCPVQRERARPRPVAAGSTAEDACEVLALSCRFGDRVVCGVFIQRGDAANRKVEERDLALEDVAEQARYAERHVDARSLQDGQRQDLDAGDPARAVVPDRAHAEVAEGLREIVATGAQGRRGPEVDDQGARVLAVILEVASHDLVRRALADGERGSARDGARIDGAQVPPGGQHVGTAAGRRTRRAGGDPPAIQRRHQAVALADRARLGVRVGYPTEDVQRVAHEQVLDVAQLGIQLGDGFAILFAPREAALLGEAGTPGALDDLGLEVLLPPAIESVGGSVLLDDAFHGCERAVQSGGAEGRIEVTYGHCRQPPLGLHRLAGVVDDEGVDHGHGSEHPLWPAVCRESDGLSGQPLQRAVRAEMDQRVNLLILAQPAIGLDVGGRRFCADIVVARAAIGLEKHDDLAATKVGLGAVQQGYDVFLAAGLPAGVEAGIPQEGEDFERALDGIQPDRVAGAAAARGIIRQHHGHAPLEAGRRRQSDPVGCQLRDIVDAVGQRGMAHTGVLEPRVCGLLLLEGNRPCQQPAVQFRQHDVHGHVAGRKAAWRISPRPLVASSQHHLEDGDVGPVEDRGVVLP